MNYLLSVYHYFLACDDVNTRHKRNGYGGARLEHEACHGDTNGIDYAYSGRIAEARLDSDCSVAGIDAKTFAMVSEVDALVSLKASIVHIAEYDAAVLLAG